MDECAPFAFREELGRQVRAPLRRMLEALLDAAARV
jgi:hypothetical protein